MPTPITVTISGRTGTASDFIGGLCSERLLFAGDPLTLPAKVALLDLDGTTLAAADLQTDDAGAVFADLSTDTQQVADRYRYQPPDTINRATLFIGDTDSLQAFVPVTVKKNWLDDTAYHPPVAPDVYPTEAELQAWLEEATKLGQEIAAVSGPALESAQKAEQAAARAQQYASDASGAAISAAKSYEQAEDARKGAQSEREITQQARENAQVQNQQAQKAAGEARGSAANAKNAQSRAERAADDAEEARKRAVTAADNALESENAARQFSKEAADSASAATAAWEATGDFYESLLAAAGLTEGQLAEQTAAAAKMENDNE